MDRDIQSRILLLEDDISLADGLCYSLQKNGYTVETAESVLEAKKMLLQKQIGRAHV